MRKFTKVALIVAAIVGTIGVGCLVGAVAKGLTWSMIADMATDGRFSFGPEDFTDFGIGDIQSELTELKNGGEEYGK